MERELYDAAIQGNVSQLAFILNQDPLILHRSSYTLQATKSPLHVSAEHGHLQFTLKLLEHNPQLTESIDSHRYSPLHSAASRGHIEIVKSLILINSDMCFACDEEGKNPVHVAAVKGQEAVLEELVRSMPRAAKERAGKEGSILHLCVKYSKLECLTLLVNSVGDGELLNIKDCEGNTVLHLAVADKQTEMLKFLLSKNYWIEKNSTNSNGLTPMDTFLQSRTDPKSKPIRKILEHSGLCSSKKLLPNENWNKHMKWLEDHRSTLMLVASLIAQMAFSAGLNPPGSVYQDGGDDKAGFSIAASDNGRSSSFNVYMGCCSVSLFSSLSIILMLVSGLPCKKLIVYVSMVTTWIAILPVPLVYFQSLIIFTPYSDVVSMKGIFFRNGSVSEEAGTMDMSGVVALIGFLWLFLLLLVLAVGHFINFSVKVVRWIRKLVNKA